MDAYLSVISICISVIAMIITLYSVKRQIEYKCQRYGIELLNVPTFYPSSKLCSQCGNIKKDLKLSDRAYHCDCCGLVIDRDYNASLNLANYQSA